MAKPPLRADAHYTDTDFVRLTFRSLIQHGVIIAAVVGALDALMFALAASPLWVAPAALVAACAGLYWMTAPARSFPVFLAGAVALMVAIIGLKTYLALRLGRDAGFHFLLLAVPPAIIVAGRLRVRTKVAIAMLFAAAMVALDLGPARTPMLDALPPWLEESMRSLNLLTVTATACAQILHYFLLVTRQQANMVHLASHDPLTGLLNRRGLFDAARSVTPHLDRQGQVLGVVLGDLDHFKQVNDRHGHETGDAALQHASALLLGVAREADLAARWGGEEFLLLLPATDLAGCERLAERIRHQLAATPLVHGDTRIVLTMTLGVAQRGVGEALDHAIGRADDRLYVGKRAGRNRVVAGPRIEGEPGVPAPA